MEIFGSIKFPENSRNAAPKETYFTVTAEDG